MKKLFNLLMLMGFLVLFMGCGSGCASNTVAVKTDPYAHLTLDNIKEQCKAQGFWQMGVMGSPAMVLRYDECFKTPVLLVTMTPANSRGGEDITIAQTVSQLLVLKYIDYLNSTDEANEWSFTRLKEETVNAEGSKTYINYFSLKSNSKAKEK